MRKYSIGFILVVTALAVPSIALAQVAQRQGAAKAPGLGTVPDLSGVWEPRAPTAGLFSKEPPPLQAWAEQKSRPNRENPQNPTSVRENDRDPYLKCAPPGVPRIWLTPTPFEIVQSAQRVLIFFESDNTIRQIWTDGRGHPKGLGKTWSGNSIGHWEGDTLVVDTIGFNDATWLDYGGNIHSDALHLTERFRRPDRTTLVIDITMEDPKAFTKPYVVKRFADLRPDWIIGEYIICEDKYLNLSR